MFAAKPHRLLVPFDGSFDARNAPTEPPKPKEDWKELLADEVKELADAQYRLFADGRFAVLVVLQARDAAGKDGTIRHVFSGVDPCGLNVASFKQPSSRELAHDFLWRTTAQLPERGNIAIFNRSYYEEVLVVRVHPEFLAAQHLPEPPSPAFWAARLRAIADHERYLAEQGTVILKFWLNVSKAEQRKRLLAAHRRAGQELEVQSRRPRRARALGRVSRRVRACSARDVAAVGAVVRRSRRRQALSAVASREARQRRARAARRRFPARRTRKHAPRSAKRRNACSQSRAESSAQYRPWRPASRCRSSSSCAGVPVNSFAGTLGPRPRELAEDLAGGEHVQPFAREVLEPQVAIGVDRGALQPRRERFRVGGERAHEVERRIETDGAQRCRDGRVVAALEAVRQAREIDRLVAVAADEHGVVARAFDGVCEHGRVREHVEKRRELAAHGILGGLVELHEDRHDAAVLEPFLAELPELARVQRGRALDPRVERIGRDRIEAFRRGREQVPAVVDADLDLAVRDDAEVVLGEVLGGDARNERLELRDDDALDCGVDARRRPP